MIKKLLFTVLVLGMMVLSITACNSSELVPNVQLQEDAKQQALEFLKNSPTFTFDGIQGSIELTDTVTLETPGDWLSYTNLKARTPGTAIERIRSWPK